MKNFFNAAPSQKKYLILGWAILISIGTAQAKTTETEPLIPFCKDLCGYKNAAGEVVIPPQYTTASRFSLARSEKNTNHWIAAVTFDGHKHFITPQGTLIFSAKEGQEIDDFEYGVARVRDSQKGQYFIMNGDGQYLNKEPIQTLYGFRDDQLAEAIVERTHTRPDGTVKTWSAEGIIKTSGDWAVPPEFENVDHFNGREEQEVQRILPNGEKAPKREFINQKGEFVRYRDEVTRQCGVAVMIDSQGKVQYPKNILEICQKFNQPDAPDIGSDAENPAQEGPTQKPTAAQTINTTLSGLWLGAYHYPNNEMPPVAFSQVLRFWSDGTLSGELIEPATFGDTANNIALRAKLTGTWEPAPDAAPQKGQKKNTSTKTYRIQWIKTYDGTGSVNHGVTYKGDLLHYPNGVMEVNGKWTTGWSGKFYLNKVSANAPKQTDDALEILPPSSCQDSPKGC